MWGFTAKNKLKIALLLFTVLSLLLLTNLQERRMINRINESVVSIYEDRVVVGDYILTLSTMTQQVVKILKEQPQDQHKVYVLLGEMSNVNKLYNKTYLTEVEKVNFDKFIQFCAQIERFYSAGQHEEALVSGLEAEKILVKLSSIQVEEGKNLLDEVLNLTGTGSFLAYIEIVVLIIIAILIQWIVLSTKPLVDRRILGDNHRMN